jgi:hypothetical protein
MNYPYFRGDKLRGMILKQDQSFYGVLLSYDKEKGGIL